MVSFSMGYFLMLTTPVIAENSDKFGDLTETPTWVEEIFEQVKRVIGKKPNQNSAAISSIKLKVYHNTPPNFRRYLAVALSSGEIVLSKAIIDNICPLDKTNTAKTNYEWNHACLAFILGHELAHLINGDELPKRFINDPDRFTQAVIDYQEKGGKEKEKIADEDGFLYAAIAGYPVDKLVNQGKDKGFFEHWVEITGINWQESPSHPNPEKRTEELIKRLEQLLAKVPYFHFGVRLCHFNRYSDGIKFLQEFEKEFPAREVFNNQGYCHLQQAIEELGAEKAYQYWLPSVLDAATRADKFSIPSQLKGETSKTAKEFLEMAKKAFESAIDADPSYLPANINLAVTQFYLAIYDNNLYNAAIEALDFKKIDKSFHSLKPIVQGLKALFLYRAGRDNGKELERISKLSNTPLFVLYNTAQMLKKRKKNSEAQDIWQRLAGHLPELPEPIKTVCQQSFECLAIKTKTTSLNMKWRLPPTLSFSKRVESQTFSNWKRVVWQEGSGKIFLDPEEKFEVLVVGDYVEMVVLKKFNKLTVKDLKKYCQQSLVSKITATGELLSCADRWSALQRNNRVEEVWILRK
jgi:tetratricopeptide (TPR) repeat protein